MSLVQITNCYTLLQHRYKRKMKRESILLISWRKYSRNTLDALRPKFNDVPRSYLEALGHFCWW